MQIINNNAEIAWDKLRLFGLRHKRSILGFNAYGGRNSEVRVLDPQTGMVLSIAAPSMAPRSERSERAITIKVPGKRGRPAIFGPIQRSLITGKRGRPAFIGPREQLVFAGPMRKRGRKPGIKSETTVEALVFYNHPMRKRGPKALTSEQKAAKQATEPKEAGAKRGRLSEKERIAMAEVGSVISANGGGFWKIIAKGLPSYIPA